MSAVSMPNAATSEVFVELATKCRAIDFSSPPRPLSDQARAARALVIVSKVAKVLEETINSVSAASRSRTASAKSVPSTGFEGLPSLEFGQYLGACSHGLSPCLSAKVLDSKDARFEVLVKS